METTTKEALTRWIRGAAPESAHPFDMKRFYNVVYECLVNDEFINSDELAEIIRENLKWNEDKIQRFSIDTAISAEKIIKFIGFLKSEKQIDIYEML